MKLTNKTIYAILGAIAGGLILFFIGKAIYNSLKAAHDNRDKAYIPKKGSGGGSGTGGSGTGGSGGGDNNTPTLTDAQAQAIADKINNAFSIVWANDFAAIKEAFNALVNDADFFLIKNKYGIKEHGSSILQPLGGNVKGGLSENLRAFLSQDQINELNGILSAKNLTPRI